MEFTKEEYTNYCVKQLKEKLNIDADAALMGAVVKHMGIAALGGDASLVSCGQESEKQTIKEKFLKGKLGLSDSDGLDAAIEKICMDLGESNTQKYRGAFYYLLAKKYGKTL
jgi:hypothetical protein